MDGSEVGGEGCAGGEEFGGVSGGVGGYESDALGTSVFSDSDKNPVFRIYTCTLDPDRRKILITCLKTIEINTEFPFSKRYFRRSAYQI